MVCTYSELMFLLSEKVQNTVSAKYQIPGEELDPDQLISVCDDGDVQVRTFQDSTTPTTTHPPPPHTEKYLPTY